VRHQAGEFGALQKITRRSPEWIPGITLGPGGRRTRIGIGPTGRAIPRFGIHRLRQIRRIVGADISKPVRWPQNGPARKVKPLFFEPPTNKTDMPRIKPGKLADATDRIEQVQIRIAGKLFRDGAITNLRMAEPAQMAGDPVTGLRFAARAGISPGTTT